MSRATAPPAVLQRGIAAMCARVGDADLAELRTLLTDLIYDGKIGREGMTTKQMLGITGRWSKAKVCQTLQTYYIGLAAATSSVSVPALATYAAGEPEVTVQRSSQGTVCLARKCEQMAAAAAGSPQCLQTSCQSHVVDSVRSFLACFLDQRMYMVLRVEVLGDSAIDLELYGSSMSIVFPNPNGQLWEWGHAQLRQFAALVEPTRMQTWPPPHSGFPIEWSRANPGAALDDFAILIAAFLMLYAPHVTATVLTTEDENG